MSEEQQGADRRAGNAQPTGTAQMRRLRAGQPEHTRGPRGGESDAGQKLEEGPIGTAVRTYASGEAGTRRRPQRKK